MSAIPTSLRRHVVERAQNRCEYCRLSQQGQAATFHVDHVHPVAAGGKTTLDNLALACVSCSLRKAARETAVDPLSETVVPIFNPRREQWRAHFQWEDVHIFGRSAIGRATIEALAMNRPLMVAIRTEEKWFGRHPTDSNA